MLRRTKRSPLRRPMVFRQAGTRRQLGLRLLQQKSPSEVAYSRRGSLFLSISYVPLSFALGDRFFPSSERHLFPTLRSVGSGADLPSPSISPDIRTGIGITMLFLCKQGDASTVNSLQQVGELTNTGQRSPSAIHPTCIPVPVATDPPSPDIGRWPLPSTQLGSLRFPWPIE